LRLRSDHSKKTKTHKRALPINGRRVRRHAVSDRILGGQNGSGSLGTKAVCDLEYGKLKQME